MPHLTMWMIRAALVQLAVGFTLGAYMLSAKGIPFDPLYRRILAPHIELLLFGWLLQLAVGMAVWILPRFQEPPKYGRIRLAWAGFILFNTGIGLVIAGGWISGPSHPLALAGHIVEALAVALFAVFLWPRVKPFMA